MSIPFQDNKIELKTGLDIAKYLKYHIMTLDSRRVRRISFVNVSGVTFYKKHEKEFDKLFEISKKYNINIKDFICFAVDKLNVFTKKDLFKLFNLQTFKMYGEKLEIELEYEKIYSYFIKSVNYIIDECIKNDYLTAKEYFKYLIQSNKLAEKVISGKISIYYLASLRHMPQIIRRMDSFNRDTLRHLVERYNMLHTEIQRAFKFKESRTVNPIDYTDRKLFSARH